MKLFFFCHQIKPESAFPLRLSFLLFFLLLSATGLLRRTLYCSSKNLNKIKKTSIWVGWQQGIPVLLCFRFFCCFFLKVLSFLQNAFRREGGGDVKIRQRGIMASLELALCVLVWCFQNKSSHFMQCFNACAIEVQTKNCLSNKAPRHCIFLYQH